MGSTYSSSLGSGSSHANIVQLEMLLLWKGQQLPAALPLSEWNGFGCQSSIKVLAQL